MRVEGRREGIQEAREDVLSGDLLEAFDPQLVALTEQSSGLLEGLPGAQLIGELEVQQLEEDGVALFLGGGSAAFFGVEDEFHAFVQREGFVR